METQKEKLSVQAAGMDPNAAVLKISGLRTCLTTRKGRLYPVDGVDLEIPRGRIVALVGESGCGKSMMANSVMGLLPQGGRVALELLHHPLGIFIHGHILPCSQSQNSI